MVVKFKLTADETVEQRVKVDPIIAAKILEDHNDTNRPIARAKVRAYATEMLKGNWRYNPADTICFDTNYQMQNGQHRMMALIDSGTTQEFMFVTGVEPRTQDVMDVGYKRNASQQLMMSGYEYATILGALARWYIKWHDGSIMANSRNPSTPDIRTWVEETDSDARYYAVRMALEYYRQSPFSTGAIGAVAYEAMVIDPSAAVTFFNGLTTGVGLEEGNPILILNRHVQRILVSPSSPKLRVHEQMWLMITTWNRWRTEGGKTITSIRLPKQLDADLFPKMK